MDVFQTSLKDVRAFSSPVSQCARMQTRLARCRPRHRRCPRRCPPSLNSSGVVAAHVRNGLPVLYSVHSPPVAPIFCEFVTSTLPGALSLLAFEGDHLSGDRAREFLRVGAFASWAGMTGLCIKRTRKALARRNTEPVLLCGILSQTNRPKTVL